LENIQLRADQPIDDSAVVEEVFGFLDYKKDNINEAHAPSAFRDLPAPAVRLIHLKNNFKSC
jgi:hypothetical protein